MTDTPIAGIANTPEPPYVAVVFTSLRTDGDHGYAAMALAMDALAAVQPGYLGVESARDGLGITVSYWRDADAAHAWKDVAAHLVAQRRGRELWYRDYRVRIATVQRDYGPNDDGPNDDGPTAGGPNDDRPNDDRPNDDGPTAGGPNDDRPNDDGPRDRGPNTGRPVG